MKICLTNSVLVIRWVEISWEGTALALCLAFVILFLHVLLLHWYLDDFDFFLFCKILLFSCCRVITAYDVMRVHVRIRPQQKLSYENMPSPKIYGMSQQEFLNRRFTAFRAYIWIMYGPTNEITQKTTRL